MDRILEACRKHGKAAGYMAGSAEETVQRVEQGFQFVAAGSDARLLGAAAAETYKKIREGLAKKAVAAKL
jgi:2-dehydro-3-deoxyglucarate aldolase/4-hydroxy-2-oxoheptanedioate aldolase